VEVDQEVMKQPAQIEENLHRVLQFIRAQPKIHKESLCQSLKHEKNTQRHRHETLIKQRHNRTKQNPQMEAALNLISSTHAMDFSIKKLSQLKNIKSIEETLPMTSKYPQVHSSEEDEEERRREEEEEEEKEEKEEKNKQRKRQIYLNHFKGLEAEGRHGLSLLQNMMDAAIEAKKKNSAITSRHGTTTMSFGASVLTSNVPSPRIYASCNIQSVLPDEKYSVCAERNVILKMLSENPDEVIKAMVICSDQMESFPFPCGSCRELMAEFGNFPVYLVKGDSTYELTSSFELFPHARHTSLTNILFKSVHPPQKPPVHKVVVEEKETQEEDVRDWNCPRVLRWLVEEVQLPEYEEIFEKNCIDGCTLLSLEDIDLQILLKIFHPLHRKQILFHLDQLKDKGIIYVHHLYNILCVKKKKKNQVLTL
jgi:cytidine deaminase